MSLTDRPRGARAFSLIELLVCISIIALLLSIALPGLRRGREVARGAACLSNQRQLMLAWTVYANDYKDLAMPLAEWGGDELGQQVFWWGTHGSATERVDYDRGFIAPYLSAALSARSVFECPAQAWGTYRAQGPSREPTSTYGYNGYYLTPAKTPGWNLEIGFRPWRRLFEIREPSTLFVFADAMLPGNPVRNCALLDPPQVYLSGSWRINNSPTTSFRHGRPAGGVGNAATARADGSVQTVAGIPAWVSPATAIGSVGTRNDPHYVPDAMEWP